MKPLLKPHFDLVDPFFIQFTISRQLRWDQAIFFLWGLERLASAHNRAQTLQNCIWTLIVRKVSNTNMLVFLIRRYWPGHVFSSWATHCASVFGSSVVLASATGTHKCWAAQQNNSCTQLKFPLHEQLVKPGWCF